MKNLLVLTFCLLAGLASTSNANPSSEEFCKKATADGVMPDMIDCTQADLDKEDKRLNAEYKEAMKRLNVAQKKELRSVQRAWIKNRDKACKLEADGGQAGILNNLGCLLEWTKKRADELAEIR